MLRFFVILRSAATKDLSPVFTRLSAGQKKILRCAQDDKEGRFAQVLCHPEERSDEGSFPIFTRLSAGRKKILGCAQDDRAGETQDDRAG